MNIKCKICGNTKNNKTFMVKERIINKGDEFEYLECSECKCVMLNEEIQDISKWYPKDYNPYHKRKKTKLTFKQKLRRNILFKLIINMEDSSRFQDILNIKDIDILLKRMYGTKIRKKDRIVDVGCGDGHWLDYLTDMGYKDVTGIDLFVPEDNVNNNRWKFVKGDIYSLTGKYDCIILNHSFEHMENPQKVLKQIGKHLSKRGICVISIPISGGVVYKKYKEYFCQLDAPRHLYLHTEISMKKMCENADLKVDRVLYDSTPSILATSKSLKNTKFSLQEIISKNIGRKNMNALYADFTKKSNLRGKGDQAIFYISKR